MTNIMLSKGEEVDYFAVMGLKPSATEAEIRRAHKKLSLALHPDKNRHMDAAVAAARFSEMQLAYEVLMDPSARLAASERYRAEQSRKERQAGFEGKRKAMADELERREEEEREKRSKTIHDERRRRETLERLREEGKRLIEERERKLQAEKDSQIDPRNEEVRNHTNGRPTEERAISPEPELEPLDLTVRLRFPSEIQNALRGESQSEDVSEGLESPLAKALTARFGALDALMFRPFKQGKREASALATFKSLDDAFAAVTAGSQLKAGGTGITKMLEDVWIGWASNKKGGSGAQTDSTSSSAARPGEPKRIAWLRRHGKLPQNDRATFEPNGEDLQNAQQSLSSRAGESLALESSILERMRGNKAS